jgi:hypothetical protein
VQSITFPVNGYRTTWTRVVYDAKQDTVSLLDGMGLRCPVHLLHPLDARGTAWDLARDCGTPATALQVASVLIPAEDGPNRFFSDAARDLLAGVLVAFNRLAPGCWALRSVLCGGLRPRRGRYPLPTIAVPPASSEGPLVACGPVTPGGSCPAARVPAGRPTATKPISGLRREDET